MSNWFDVDKAGLAKLMAGRPKAFVLFELCRTPGTRTSPAWTYRLSRSPAPAMC